MDKRSVAKQVLDILEDAEEPLTIGEIRSALTTDVTSSHVLASISHHIKIGKIKKKTRAKEVKENIFSL